MRATLRALRPGLGVYHLSLVVKRRDLVNAELQEGELLVEFEVDYLDLLRLLGSVLPALVSLTAEVEKKLAERV